MDMEATWRVEWVADGLTGWLAGNRCQAGFKWLLAQVEQVNGGPQQSIVAQHNNSAKADSAKVKAKLHLITFKLGWKRGCARGLWRT